MLKGKKVGNDNPMKRISVWEVYKTVVNGKSKQWLLDLLVVPPLKRHKMALERVIIQNHTEEDAILDKKMKVQSMRHLEQASMKGHGGHGRVLRDCRTVKKPWKTTFNTTSWLLCILVCKQTDRLIFWRGIKLGIIAQWKILLEIAAAIFLQTLSETQLGVKIVRYRA